MYSTSFYRKVKTKQANEKKDGLFVALNSLDKMWF